MKLLKVLKMNSVTKFSIPFKRAAIPLIVVSLVGCQTAPLHYTVKQSHLEQVANQEVGGNKAETQLIAKSEQSNFEFVQPLMLDNHNSQASQKDELNFSSKTKVKAAADAMSIVDFIHHSFGGVLKTNYVIDEAVKGLSSKVTLNIQDDLSEREFYKQLKNLLKQHNASISYKDNVYYIYSLNLQGQGQVAIGIGNNPDEIPTSNGQVLQIIPLQFGIKISLERTLNQLSKAKITPDFDQSTLFVQGTYSEVKQVIDLVALLDKPANRAKHIGFLNLTYISPDDFVNQAVMLLENEGVPAGVGKPDQKNVVLVPLVKTSGVAVFASSEEFVKRVEMWAKKLDQPPQGNENQFFIYNPQYARAKDLGDSLAPLFGGKQAIKKGNESRDTKSAVANKLSSDAVNNGDLKMIVDERSNMVIFETSGTRYQNLLPLIKRLDVMPRQVLLEATIAEVTLSDEFKLGVEFDLKNGNFGYSTKGAFGLADIGGSALTWAGSVNTAQLNAMQGNKLINILSNPTLLVRDGTTASITVGDEISIDTSSDINDQTNIVRKNIERRQTGLTLTVTPTINTAGVVIMEIEQKISNSSDDGSQTILVREINTEVVANSGQTIILGGLISESRSNGDKKVPGLADIPIIGNLFKTKSESNKKTELVILVTPKIIYDEQQWSEIKRNFSLGLENVSF